MKELKFRKISDEGNVYGFNEIVFLKSRIYTVKTIEKDDEPIQIYRYEYLVIADGELTAVNEIEWFENAHHYKLVK